jgi:biotin-dependent carboxylase-like uncharacterized protein
MDAHAASWANRLLDNPPKAPLLELLLQGARLECLTEMWVAVTGADACASVPRWRAVHLHRDDVIEFPRHQAGVWSYLAVAGGFSAVEFFGSRSTYAAGGLGKRLEAGDVLSVHEKRNFALPPGVASRMTPPLEQRDYSKPPRLRVWMAPQAGRFASEEVRSFFSQDWTISNQSDRVGYRLLGEPLRSIELPWSEPMRVGTVQVPNGGEPIVMMRDGPTIGGYPKLGVLEPAALCWLAQCCPGQKVRFAPAGEWPVETS